MRRGSADADPKAATESASGRRGPAETAVEGLDLAPYLSARRKGIERALSRVLDRWSGQLRPDLSEAIRHGALGGGKRVRAILTIEAYRAVGGTGPEEASEELGAAVELIHAYSLMHDDLPCMDAAELRRGKPTTHRVHGVPVTTVAGAAMIPVAVATALGAAEALGCPEVRRRRVARELCAAAGAGGMVGGQALDLLGEGEELGEEDLERLHGLKTGALLTGSLRIGAVAGGGDAEALDALDRYGRAIGLAFQIADDVLDATASARELGKNPSDREMEKSTYVALHGLEGARRRAREQVERAVVTLDTAGIDSPALRAIARYIVDRRR